MHYVIDALNCLKGYLILFRTYGSFICHCINCAFSFRDASSHCSPPPFHEQFHTLSYPHVSTLTLTHGEVFLHLLIFLFKLSWYIYGWGAVQDYCGFCTSQQKCRKLIFMLYQILKLLVNLFHMICYWLGALFKADISGILTKQTTVVSF
jgi:hypothetical protein